MGSPKMEHKSHGLQGVLIHRATHVHSLLVFLVMATARALRSDGLATAHSLCSNSYTDN